MSSRGGKIPAQPRSASLSLVIKGLHQDGVEGAAPDTFLMDVNPETEVATVFQQLSNNYKTEPLYLVDEHQQKYFSRFSQSREKYPVEHVEVVRGPSDYAVKHINIDDTYLHFIDLEFGKRELSARLDPPSSTGSQSLLVDDALQITFHRTIRLPDDDRLHPLPQSLGLFPLYNTEAFSMSLPEKHASRGGIFFPMWQREALWINFQRRPTGTDTKYALRINLGQINALSGLAIEEVSGKQDYIVVPGQAWIDGIVVAPGVVRQFVAMPVGSGYTVEGQVTKEEKFGGIQIQVTPSYSQRYNKAFALGTGTGLAPVSNKFGQYQTPRECGLSVGNKIEMVPVPAFFSRPAKMKDFFANTEDASSAKVLILKATYPPQRGSKRLVSVASRRRCCSSGRPAQLQIMQGQCAQPPRPQQPQSVQPSISAQHLSTQPLSARGFGIQEQSVGFCAIDEHRDFAFGLSTDEALERSFSDSAPEPKAPRFDIKEMGIAAGGKLMQDIIADHEPPYIWNKSRTQLVNIQIFDSASFESLTHLVAPPTPVTAKAYTDAGLPFYYVEEDPDNRLEGAEVHANVKSIAAMDKETGINDDPEGEYDPMKPKKCSVCKIRLCDCIVRPCNHQFCNICISTTHSHAGAKARCPLCSKEINLVAGFSAPMNLPNEEAFKTDVPVVMLRVTDGRPEFQSVRKMRL